MKTYQIITHSLNELSKDAQQNAIENIKNSKKLESEIEFQYEIFSEDTKEYLKELNFNNIELYYSLSYCQGDGLCFIGDIYLSDLFKNENFLNLLTDKQKRNLKIK